LLVLGDALEVDVLHLRLERMHVHGAQQHLLLGAVERKRQNGGVEFLVPQALVEILVVELDGDRFLVAAVDDAGHPAQAAQPATDRLRIFLQARASSRSGMVSVTTSSSSGEPAMRSTAPPESTAWVQ